MSEEELLVTLKMFCCQAYGIGEKEFEELNQNEILSNIFKFGISTAMQMTQAPSTPKIQKSGRTKVDVLTEELENGSRRRVTIFDDGLQLIEII